MKNTASRNATCMGAVAALFVLASPSVGFAKGQEKSTESNQEKPEALLVTAMKKMSAGVWSVNGSVTPKKTIKTIKLRGLLSGEDFDLEYLAMEPGSLRRSLAATRRGFDFYVADPLSSIHEFTLN
jgi:hypothetical protein